MQLSVDHAHAFMYRFAINFEGVKGRIIPFVVTREHYQQYRDFYMNHLWNTLPMQASADEAALLDGIHLPIQHDDDLLARINQHLSYYPAQRILDVYRQMEMNKLF